MHKTLAGAVVLAITASALLPTMAEARPWHRHYHMWHHHRMWHHHHAR